jgi:hypothetical protein
MVNKIILWMRRANKQVLQAYINKDPYEYCYIGEPHFT